MRNKKVFQIFSRCFPQREWQGSTLLLKPLNIIEAKNIDQHNLFSRLLLVKQTKYHCKGLLI